MHAQELLAFGDNWSYIGLAAELSLTQVENDVKLLEREIGKVKTEYDMAKKQVVASSTCTKVYAKSRI